MVLWPWRVLLLVVAGVVSIVALLALAASAIPLVAPAPPPPTATIPPDLRLDCVGPPPACR